MATKTADSSNDNDDDKSLFQRVQSSGEICGNCFRRTNIVVERNYAVDTYKVDDFEWETWARKVDLPDRSWPIYGTRTNVPQEPVATGVEQYCKCGYPRHEQLRPLPKELFFSYAGNLIKRYAEMGVEIDPHRFFDELHDMKTNPDEQFADDRLYDRATDVALNHVVND